MTDYIILELALDNSSEVTERFVISVEALMRFLEEQGEIYCVEDRMNLN